MSKIDPRLLDLAFVAQDTPRLADILTRVQASDALSARRTPTVTVTVGLAADGRRDCFTIT